MLGSTVVRERQGEATLDRDIGGAGDTPGDATAERGRSKVIAARSAGSKVPAEMLLFYFFEFGFLYFLLI